MTWAASFGTLAVFLAALVTPASSTAITNGLVKVTPTTYVTAGKAVTNIWFEFDTNAALTSGQTITITANGNVWAGTSATTCTALKEGSALTAGSPNDFTTATSSLTTLVITAGANGLAGGGGGVTATYAFTCTDNLASLTPDGTPLTFSFVSTTDVTPLTGISGWTPGGAITSVSFANVASTATPAAGTSPTSFAFTFTLPTDCTSSQGLMIEGSQSWLDMTAAGTPPTAAWSVSFTTAPVCTKTSATRLTCIPDVSDAIDQAVATTLTLTNEIKYHSATSTAQQFTIIMGPSSVTSGAQVPQNSGNVDSAVISNAYTTSASGGAVTGDPVTYFGDTRTEFNLPLGVLTSIMEVPDMHIFASAFEGSNAEEQWMDRILVKTPSGEKIADIAIKRDLLNFDRRNIPRNAFETLDVVMWDEKVGPVTPLTILPPTDAYFPHPVGVTITYTRAGACPMNNATVHIPCRECASVFGKYVKFLICATSAHEYFKGGYGSYKYAHLDFDVFDVDLRPEATSQYGGVLPEIWELAPMSNATRGMIKTQERISDVVDNPIDVSESTSDNGVGECKLSSCKSHTNAI